MIRSIKELSIIIPAYNEFNNLKHLIKKTNSILLKNKNVEIIIVDNGSTDGSKNYLQYNKKLFSKIKFVRVKKNFDIKNFLRTFKFDSSLKSLDLSFNHLGLDITIIQELSRALKEKHSIKETSCPRNPRHSPRAAAVPSKMARRRDRTLGCLLVLWTNSRGETC